MTEYREYYRRHLPHWQPEGATFFVTFRLAGSLPASVIARLKKERDQERQALSNIRDHQQREQQAYEDERRAFGRWDDALDCVDAGPRWLAQMQVASIVEQALHYWHSKVYELAAFCIMPNHVHLVCTPLTQEDGKYYSLAQILHSL